MKRAVFLDIAAYIISTFFLGLTFSFAAGLLLGTSVLFCSLHLLRISLQRMEEDARQKGVADQKRYYLLYTVRLLLFAAAFSAAVLFPKFLSPIAVALPMLYPRLIYTAGALFRRSDSASGGKKR